MNTDAPEIGIEVVRSVTIPVILPDETIDSIETRAEGIGETPWPMKPDRLPASTGEAMMRAPKTIQLHDTQFLYDRCNWIIRFSPDSLRYPMRTSANRIPQNRHFQSIHSYPHSDTPDKSESHYRFQRYQARGISVPRRNRDTPARFVVR